LPPLKTQDCNAIRALPWSIGDHPAREQCVLSALIVFLRPLLAGFVAKPFCTRDQNFFWLYTRFSCKDVGDLIA
jgi:hypothetical protein